MVRAEQVTELDVKIAKSGEGEVTLTTGEDVDGKAEFRDHHERRVRQVRP